MQICWPYLLLISSTICLQRSDCCNPGSMLTHLRLKILGSKYFNVARCNLGPATSMTVLGTEQDSVNQVACLPEGKLLALRELIYSWMPHRWWRKRELESLTGHLHHAATVVARDSLSPLVYCCAASVTRTSLFGLTRSFVLIFSGGSSFYPPGMKLGSGCILACLLPQTWRSPWMWLVWLALVPILETSGFMVPGQLCRPGNLLHTKNFFCSECRSPLAIFVG